MTTPSGDLVVLALHRGGEEIAGPEVTLRAGDTLLVRGDWTHLEEHTSGPEVLVVDPPGMLRRAIPLGRGAKRAIVTLGVMVVVLTLGWFPPVMVGLLAAGALVVSGVLSITEAYRAVSWTTVILVAGMIPLSDAFGRTGAADMVASGLLGVVGDTSPHLALLALCVTTAVLTQLMSNTVTVLVMIPVATVMAEGMHASVLPFMMALAVSAAGSFLTPVATPANAMVLEPGGYRFGDYWKLGLPVLAWFLVVAVLWVPVVWPFN